MSSEKQIINPEQELLDSELFDLYRPTENWLPPEECISGHFYYGGARSIGEIAICRGFKENFKATEFEGIRNKFGHDYLFGELHWDEGGIFGTYRPFVDLGEAPIFETEEETMWWLHYREIELVESRIDWLKAMPSRLKAAHCYPFLLNANLESLVNLELINIEGFSAHPSLTFRQLMEQKKAKAST